ncbi:hypothetical protein [Bacilliculturomica massiliensis]|uniref:hypothetical protein n=1 Tax=Bacilliculturomica massiliensis TaxID=1917867 RepID=UPI0010301B12|nr:hypothetical protein [Bacilliculturomica massiliensis]
MKIYKFLVVLVLQLFLFSACVASGDHDFTIISPEYTKIYRGDDYDTFVVPQKSVVKRINTDTGEIKKKEFDFQINCILYGSSEKQILAGANDLEDQNFLIWIDEELSEIQRVNVPYKVAALAGGEVCDYAVLNSVNPDSDLISYVCSLGIGGL